MAQEDIDLQKIQILESGYQGWFNFKTSLVAGIIVGTIILIATIQYEKIFPFYAVPFAYLILIIGALLLISDMKKTHEEQISFINGLMMRIEKGDKLESIEELREMHRKSAEANNIKLKSRIQKLKNKLNKTIKK